MSEEFLTNEEILALTGREKPSAQIKWLSENGWRFIKNAKGLPVVGRFYCRQKMASDVQMVDDTPNFGAVM